MDEDDMHDAEDRDDWFPFTLEDLGPDPEMVSPNSKQVKQERTKPELGSCTKTHRNRVKQRTEFNPWRELDKASKKSMTRRQILQRIFRFLPEKKEE
jgi:hypothetical protein